MKKNGTIYIKHPYIDVVNKSEKAYVAQDTAAYKSCYADTAIFWDSGMTDTLTGNLEQAVESVVRDFKY